MFYRYGDGGLLKENIKCGYGIIQESIIFVLDATK
jgi:hypothetical protein